MKSKEKVEYYFIQLLFNKNWRLLKEENKELYNALFSEYSKIYSKGKDRNIDLMEINKKFINRL